MTAAGIEIIIPVYNAPDDLRCCLDALVDRLPAGARVQIVDDASPDPGVAAILRNHPIVSLPTVAVWRNLRNLGFVRSVNAAMDRSSDDVVLLNSDTIVTRGWLDRIIACAGGDTTIATITPFSNNAEICSLPGFCQANPVPDDPERVARAAASAGDPVYPAIPTGVGFCMYIRRAAWTAVGAFDGDTFGRGYGEENDWCFRASALGWRHVLCDDAYVVHVGGMSFAGTGHRPGGGQMEKLLALHPDYDAVIADFIARDPIAPRRQAIAARLDEMARHPDPDEGNESPALPFTGERFTPECVREIWYEHWHRYAFVLPLARGKRVLDAACGEGYGSALMARVAERVSGIDLDEETIQHGRQRYADVPGLALHQGSVTRIDAEDGVFDLVVSFETIEHLTEQEQMLDEFRRVLSPDGLLVISSPDREAYNAGAAQPNPYHVRELDRAQFMGLLAERFPATQLFGQKLGFHSLLWRMDESGAGCENLVVDPASGEVRSGFDPAPVYHVAICAARPELLPDLPGLSLFADEQASVYSHYNTEIDRLIRADHRIIALEREIAALKAARVDP